MPDCSYKQRLPGLSGKQLEVKSYCHKVGYDEFHCNVLAYRPKRQNPTF
jgi:hypothetical protein